MKHKGKERIKPRIPLSRVRGLSYREYRKRIMRKIDKRCGVGACKWFWGADYRAEWLGEERPADVAREESYSMYQTMMERAR